MSTLPYCKTEYCNGKLFAPEFLADDLETLRALLQETGVKDIRKLYRDPAKANIPLYVLAFFGTRCPTRITVGYTLYRLDSFFPLPMRCSKCNKYKHSAITCRAPEKICSKCGKTDHLRENCQSTTLCCANCHQNHGSGSKGCPYYKIDLSVCKIGTKRGISFREARQLVRESSTHDSLQLSQLGIRNQGLGFKSPRNIYNYITYSSQGQLIESLPDISS